ncbi:hypothetical protein ACN27J_20340 [Solwaraspora sp. WMMB762]|uniref:hypothetical protein n=1 Tax=Solwaraspora sp. WMMB762 TaxID=3404120 RepID=UPI003B93141A
MSDPGGATEAGSGKGWWPLAGGFGVAALGHALAVAALTIPVRALGASSPSEDLGVGGRFAVIYAVLCTYASVHVILLTVGLVFVWSERGNRMFKRGLVTGWVGGWALIIAIVATWFALAES